MAKYNLKSWAHIQFKICLLCCFLLCNCGPRVVHVREDGFSKKKSTPLYKVAEVLSGDSVRLDDGRVVKYLGVDAPEVGEPFYSYSKNSNEYLIRKAKYRVALHFEKRQKDNKDLEGRCLAYVYAPKVAGLYIFVNKEMVQYGRARAEKLPTTYKYARNFIELEQRAKHRKLGIWKK